ncbi:MAG: divalent-cation tolerance protein CutA [Mycobacteriales bacterium]
MDEGYLRVETTVGSLDEAGRIAEAVVAARTAACAQVLGPITSTYRWQGAVERSAEYLVVMKTTAARYPELEQQLTGLHSYDVPEIVAVPVTAGSPAYLAWVTAETGS